MLFTADIDYSDATCRFHPQLITCSHSQKQMENPCCDIKKAGALEIGIKHPGKVKYIEASVDRVQSTAQSVNYPSASLHLIWPNPDHRLCSHH